MIFKNHIWLFALVLFCSQIFAENSEIDEIIVTADFRERPLTEIPSSVTVIDSSFVEEAAVQHFEELTFPG